MGHPEVTNSTPFAFEPLVVCDEEGQSLLALLTKATYDIVGDRRDRLVLADEQIPVSFEGECYGAPGESSYRYEPEVAWEKRGTDVVLIGHACAPRPNTRVLDVGFRVGPVRQIARIYGDRAWIRVMGRVSPTEPRVFERMPLIYERAFGGVDASLGDPVRTFFEERNPVGRGYRHKKGRFEEHTLLPNIESPTHPVRSYNDQPAPVGFGFVSPNWQPRARYAGTYDKRWSSTREPLLPADFDRRFFNAAAPELIVRGWLRGDESVQLQNISDCAQSGFSLPGQPPPSYGVRMRRGSNIQRNGNLDTVIINTDDQQVQLLWRACVTLPAQANDVRTIDVTTAMVAAQVSPLSRSHA